MGKIPFLKMHGLGNDFVVIDFRRSALPVSARGAACSPIGAPASVATSWCCSNRPGIPPPRS